MHDHKNQKHKANLFFVLVVLPPLPLDFKAIHGDSTVDVQVEMEAAAPTDAR